MRMPNFSIKIFVLHIIIFILPLHGYALEKATHEVINEYIAEHLIDGFSFDQYLKEQLGFQEGRKEVFNNKRVSQWLGYGGRKEDEPMYFRSFRHFHNPLEDWDEAGLWVTFESSIIWGQRTDQWPGGHYSWQDVRDYFHLALTSEYQNIREYYFAETFRGLGQLMHLVEDASVPLHTRNDAHVLFNYEKWVDKFQRNKYRSDGDSVFNEWLSNESRYGYDKSVLSIAPNSLAPIPVARIIDTDKYIGNNPEITKSEPVGIAEYTNANFLSNGTIPGTIFDGDFPYPYIPDLPRSDWEITDPRDTSTEVIRSYFETGYYNDVDGRYRLATVPMFEIIFYEHLDEEYLAVLPTSLDKNVYQDYAERLIPRAVGYSAGLLDYFFRGIIEIADFEMQIDTIPGHYQTKVGFNKVTLYAKNTSPESESMDQGTVHLVVKYKVDENERFLQTPSHPSMEFQYITKQFEDVNNADPLIHSIPSDNPKQFEFDLSDNPIPLNATEIYFYLVYRGTLGLEDDGVGVGYVPFVESRIIDVGLSDEGVYALTDQDPTSINPTTQGFDSIALSAKSVDPENRNMSGGTVQLVVKYLVAQENQFQNPPPNPTLNFNYIVKELPGLQAIPNITSDPIKFEFDLSDSQIPLWATDIYLYLVYKGQIGSQEEAVAVGFKDISEPTLISYYNSMDKICIHGVMYDAGDEAYAIAVDLGQEDEWDVYPHDRENVYIKYSSFENPQFLTPSFDTYNYNISYQAAGEYLKLFILTDYQFAENSSDGEIVVTDPRDDFDHYVGNYIGAVFGLNAIKNQIEVAGPESPYYDPNQFVYLRSIPEFSQYRDIENSWWVFSLINRPLPEGSPDNENCSFE